MAEIKKKKTSGINTYLLGLVALCIGVALVAGAFIYKQSNEKKTQSWIRADATVVDYTESTERNSDGDYQRMYMAIVEYTVDGQRYRKTENAKTNVRPTIGSVRKIAYNPANPQDCTFISSDNLMFVVLCIIGGTFCLVGLLSVVMRFSMRPRRKRG